MYLFHQLIGSDLVVFFEKVLDLKAKLFWGDWYCCLKRVVIIMLMDEDKVSWDDGAFWNLVN